MFNFFKSLFSKKSVDTALSVPTFPLGAKENEPDVRDILFTAVHPMPEAGVVDDQYLTDVSALGELYQLLGTCVAHAFVFAKMFADYLETGVVTKYMVRFLYALTRRYEGDINTDASSNQGLQQRQAAKVLTALGVPKTSALDDETLPHSKYVNGFADTPDMRAEATKAMTGGFAFPAITVAELKHAIKTVKIVPVTVGIDWGKLDKDGTLHTPVNIAGRHEIDLHGWDAVNGGRFIAKNWWPGYETLYIPFSELAGIVCDAISFTDIPNDLLARAKETPYVFLTDLKGGSSGMAVLKLQQRLIGMGLLNISSPTGNYGSLTAAAVSDYQRLKGLPPVGVFGPQTRQAMNADAGNNSPLLNSVIKVESGGDDNAHGDIGYRNPKTGVLEEAFGCLQIRQGVVDNVNAKLGTKYKPQDCLGNRSLSVLIWNIYWIVWPALDTDEKKARAWNGGPGWQELYGKPGYKKYSDDLDAYWAKVKANL